MRKIILLVSFVILLVGCAAPVLNIENEPIPNPSNARISVSDVEKAILTASQERGWNARVIKPGLIEASIAVRTHRAAVEIPYSQNNYSINYKSSENLKYDSSTNSIHANYSSWIKRLQISIQNAVSAL